jgi:hypothetical protein
MKNSARFRQFIADFTRLVERSGEEAIMFEHDGKLLKALLTTAQRLPPSCRLPHGQ